MSILRILFLAGLLTACANTPPLTTDTVSKTPLIAFDTRGCMIQETSASLPKKPETMTERSVTEYYEELEWHYLTTAERCLSSEELCVPFEKLSLYLEQALLSQPHNYNDVDLATKNSNNKLIAMVAINTLAYEKQYGKKINIDSWLSEQLKKNDLTTTSLKVKVRLENKTYSFGSHNMASTSARAFMYVGLLTGNLQWQEKASSQIATILQTLRPDGSLPIETRRGARGLRYSMQVLSDLIAISALSEKRVWEKHKAPLLKMKDFDISVLENNSKISEYAKEGFSPGPITDFKKQDISSLRSRLAWLQILAYLDPQVVERVHSIKIDKSSCSEEIMKPKLECSSKIQTLGDVFKSPLGFTLGFNPRCVDIQKLR